MNLKTRTLAVPESWRSAHIYEPDQIHSRRHRALRDYGRLYTAHAAVAHIAVAAEFAAGSASAAFFESDAAEHAGYQSECSTGIADAAKSGTTEIVEI
jgi:hypothetical protein